MVKYYRSLKQIIKENKLENIKCTNDSSAWIENPEYNFVYNKLWIAQSQSIPAAPMNVYPSEYPVIFKPIINLLGMSRGIKIIRNKDEYDLNLKDGFFWEEYLQGDHWTIDLIIIKGEIKFTSCLRSFSGEGGTFKYHESLPEFKLPEHLKYWIKEYLNDYTGPINLECINGLIIELHLRLNGDFQLYNDDFVISLDNLYKTGKWQLDNFRIKKKYLIPIFIHKNTREEIINVLKEKMVTLIDLNDIQVNSILIDNEKSLSQPDEYSRLFMIDSNSLENGLNIKKNILKYQTNYINE